MFNLLVSGKGWAESRDTVYGGRTFEYTDPVLEKRFKPAGKLDFNALVALPTVFMQETSGRNGKELARVGRITIARNSGRDIAIEYVYELSIPPIPNWRMEELAVQLDIEPSEFTRTHWAVKDVDLFGVLMRNQTPINRKPKVFQLLDPEAIEDDLVSVMMPFHPDFKKVFASIKRIAAKHGMRCLRADDIWIHRAVIQDIVSLIDRSRVVVCDCTGKNPNVFYEIGIADALGREVILIAQSEADIPFDLRHLRFAHYLNNRQGLSELSEKLGKRLASLTI